MSIERMHRRRRNPAARSAVGALYAGIVLMITPLIAAIDHAPVLTTLSHWTIFAYGVVLVVYGAAVLTRTDADPNELRRPSGGHDAA